MPPKRYRESASSAAPAPSDTTSRIDVAEEAANLGQRQGFRAYDRALKRGRVEEANRMDYQMRQHALPRTELGRHRQRSLFNRRYSIRQGRDVESAWSSQARSNAREFSRRREALESNRAVRAAFAKGGPLPPLPDVPSEASYAPSAKPDDAESAHSARAPPSYHGFTREQMKEDQAAKFRKARENQRIRKALRVPDRPAEDPERKEAFTRHLAKRGFSTVMGLNRVKVPNYRSPDPTETDVDSTKTPRGHRRVAAAAGDHDYFVPMTDSSSSKSPAASEGLRRRKIQEVQKNRRTRERKAEAVAPGLKAFFDDKTSTSASMRRHVGYHGKKAAPVPGSVGSSSGSVARSDLSSSSSASSSGSTSGSRTSRRVSTPSELSLSTISSKTSTFSHPRIHRIPGRHRAVPGAAGPAAAAAPSSFLAR